MDITYYSTFGNLRYVHVMEDTCLTFMYEMAMADEKGSHDIKAMKLVMLVMRVPWAPKTGNRPVYSSQQAIIGRANHFLKRALA